MYSHLSWGVSEMRIDVLADFVARSVGDQSVTVAVLDTGIDSAHPYLNGKLLSNGKNYVNGGSLADDSGHGTSVAGIIADCTQGLNVNILPIKVLDADGKGDAEDIADGIYYAIQEDADIINLSLAATENILSKPLDDAIDDALEAGIVVVAAAGNHHRSISTVCPAHRDDIIVVAAVDEDLNNMYFYDENDMLQSSNYGGSVDVTAPGVKLKVCIPFSKDSDGDGYGEADGTSMAAPHITAIAAMLKLLYPDASPVQVEALIKSCAKDLGDEGRDDIYGMGFPLVSHLITGLPFGDIHESDWFYDMVLDVYKKGCMTGKGDTGYFDSMSYLVRQDAALLLYRMAGSPAVLYRDIYPDVSVDDYFANAAVWAYDSGVMTGNSGKLGAWSNIYRQDFALILFRYANYMGYDTSARGDLSDYADGALTSEYAWEAMEWAVGAGILGQSVENLNPLGYVNRAETAAMISRFTNLYGIM